jgi:hypothetical protein
MSLHNNIISTENEASFDSTFHRDGATRMSRATWCIDLPRGSLVNDHSFMSLLFAISKEAFQPRQLLSYDRYESHLLHMSSSIPTKDSNSFVRASRGRSEFA